MSGDPSIPPSRGARPSEYPASLTAPKPTGKLPCVPVCTLSKQPTLQCSAGAHAVTNTTNRLRLVVPIHGRRMLTERFLESYQRQTLSCPLLFVDDASPDDSVAWLRLRGCDVYVPQERLWFNGIVNWAIETCEAPYLGIINNDVVLSNRFVEESVRTFDRTSFDILVPRTLSPDAVACLDRRSRVRVVSLWRQEGWCILCRVASVRRLPPIPTEHLRLWYGDTWLFHHAWAGRLRVGKMMHVCVVHTGGCSAQPDGEASRTINRDREQAQTRYPFLKPRRPLGRLRMLPKPLRRMVLPYV